MAAKNKEVKKGRRPVLDAAMIKKIGTAVSRTTSFKSAAAAVGISIACFYNWKQQAEEIRTRLEDDESFEPDEKEGLLLDFLDAVEQGLAKVRDIAVNSVIAAAKRGDWRAGESILRRRFHDEFADGDRIGSESDASPVADSQTGVLIIPGPIADFKEEDVIDQQSRTAALAAARLAEFEAEETDGDDE
ncbi:TPA: hypothetical protein ACRMAA_002003 [Pseudomonas aeruginosa]